MGDRHFAHPICLRRSSGVGHAANAEVRRKGLPGSGRRARRHPRQARPRAGRAGGVDGQDKRFQAIKDQGYIGPEQRLDWVEAIARIKAARRIYRIDYDFAPQRLADASVLPGGPAAGGFDVMASQMRMQVQFLHEGELLALIDDLRKSVRALIQLRSCSIERAPAGTGDRNNPALLKAECIMEWITLRERK